LCFPSPENSRRRKRNSPFSPPSSNTTSTIQLFAGHETTGTTIARLLRELDSRPELVARLREEQAGCVADFGRSLSPESMARMRLTDATVSEALRTWPIVNGVFRAALRDLEVRTAAGGRFLVPEG
jgi:cytochrome P450